MTHEAEIQRQFSMPGRVLSRRGFVWRIVLIAIAACTLSAAASGAINQYFYPSKTKLTASVKKTKIHLTATVEVPNGPTSFPSGTVSFYGKTAARGTLTLLETIPLVAGSKLGYATADLTVPSPKGGASFQATFNPNTQYVLSSRSTIVKVSK